MRRLFFILGIGCAWAAGALAGRADNLDRTVSGQDVTATLASPFSVLPPGGCVPFRVTIRNDAGSPGTWRVSFHASTNMMDRRGSALNRDVSVAANASGSFDFLVPLVEASSGGGSITFLQAGIEGPGFTGTGAANGNFAYFYNSTSGTRSPFMIIGQDLLGPGGTGLLESWYKNHGREFYGSEIDTANLPADWRAYSGVAAICLKDTEWLGLNPAQHDAVCDYVAQGGDLVLFTNENTFTTENNDSRAQELRLPEPDGKPGPYGFGMISLESSLLPPLPPDAATLDAAIERHAASSAQDIDQNFSTWNLRQLVGNIAVSGAFILAFVILFGGLVGPVNMFVFARGKNRFRLFWTTPLISILASLALITGILLTDGLGGSGRQMIVIYSLPGASREAVIQEQVARTAVLFTNRWRNEQNYLITPVSAQSLKNAREHDGALSLRGSDTDLGESSDSYVQNGDELSGSWFRSRAVSGQYLQAVRPSRSVLTILNPAALDSGQPPVLLSSFPQTLTKVFLIDQKWNYWTCDHLEPGRKQTCTPSSGTDYQHFWAVACDDAGGKLNPGLSRVYGRAGCFYATGTPPAGDTLATLGEIRWQVVSGIYLGPWVASSATENPP